MRIALVLVFALLFNLAGGPVPSSDPKPDLSGIWNARILKQRDSVASIQTLKISYNDPKLKITRIQTPQKPRAVMGHTWPAKSSRDSVYYTDGRSETKRGVGNSSVKSKTERIGEKFVTTETVTAKVSGREITTLLTITLEVSSDGKVLTETFTSVSDLVNTRRVNLFDRVGDNNTKDINGEWAERPGNKIISLNIEHRDPEIKVTRRVVSEEQDETETYVYYSDGRGETNVREGRSIKSVTKWKDSSLVIASSRKSTIEGDTVETKESITWKLGKDGSFQEVTEKKTSSQKGIVIPTSDVNTLTYARSSKPLP